jgi:hypothetical protein
MSKHPFVFGHEPLDKRLNVRKALRRWRPNPLLPLLNAIPQQDEVFEGEVSMCGRMYWYYYLSLERFLPEMSLNVRWSKGPQSAKEDKRPLSEYEQRLDVRYWEIARFVEYDFFNCLIYARILLDRTIALSRFFLREKNKPSFDSFYRHKKFFKSLKAKYGDNEVYAEYMREKTDWFETPLKYIRDHFLVHSAPPHIRTFGFPPPGHELGFAVILPDKEKLLGQVRWIVVSIPRLAIDMETYLSWFCRYGIERVRR